MVNKNRYPHTTEILETKIGEALLKKHLLQADAETFDNVPSVLTGILVQISELDAEINHWRHILDTTFSE